MLDAGWQREEDRRKCHSNRRQGDQSLTHTQLDQEEKEQKNTGRGGVLGEIPHAIPAAISHT